MSDQPYTLDQMSADLEKGVDDYVEASRISAVAWQTLIDRVCAKADILPHGPAAAILQAASDRLEREMEKMSEAFEA